MAIRQISVFLTDEPGALAELTEILMNNDISMRALSVADSKDFGIVRIITDDPDATVAVLGDAGFVCSVTPVLALGLDDKAGAMHKLLKTLGEKGINIFYSYAFTTFVEDTAYMVVRVEDVEEATKALADTSVRVLEQKELARMK